MVDIFIQSFGTTFLSMLKILFVVLLAGFLLRRNIVTQENLRGLSVTTIDVFLPCLSFTSILTHFRPGEFAIWWVLPIAGILITTIGMLLGWLFFYRELPEKRNMIPLASIQNAAYLILPLGAVLFPQQFEQFSVYVFLFVMGQSIPIWTIGKQLTTSGADTDFRWKDMVTPPMVATLLAITCVSLGLHSLFIPEGVQRGGIINTFFPTIFGAMQLIGTATPPLAIFILGGVLGSITLRFRSYLFDAIRVLAIKFVLLPLLTLLTVLFFSIGETNPLLAIFFVIESSSAPAIAIALQVKKYGGDEQKIGSILVLTYLACLVMLPFWIATWTLVAPT
ncbi:MAG: AEC family transporter [Desulforhopalus sp.]